MNNAEQGGRLDLGLNREWAFTARWISRGRARSGEINAAETVDLPHSWNRLDTFQPGKAYRRGYGSYTRSFLLPAALCTPGTFWMLETGGFYGIGDLWVNGRRVGPIDGQYLGFRREVGGLLLPGERNRITVRLDNRYHPYVLPGMRMPDFLLYGGLAGRMLLRRMPELHMDTYGLQVLADPDLRGKATVALRCPVVNRSARARSITLRWVICDAAGADLGAREIALSRLDPRQTREAGDEQTVSPVRPWSPDDPYMYTVKIELLEEGRVVDAAELPLGIRRAVFESGQGLLLNGERLPLRGANRHEYIPGFCNALPPALHAQDAQVLKDYGFNFVRLAHYPQHPAFLDACDRLGLLVYAEIATWKSVRAGRWLRAARRQMQAMIERDRNHPSVVLWGMGNESRSRRAYRSLHDLAKALDPSRATVYAENMLAKGVKAGTLDIPDVLGLNYKLDQAPAALEKTRCKVLVASETSNRPQSRRGCGDRVAEQIELMERDLGVIEDKPYVAGYALWSFNDYGTQRKNRYVRYCGVVDAWRLPKMTACWHRARAGGPLMIHAFADWAETGGSAVRKVRLFTNAAEVEVLVNGRSVERRPGAPRMTLEIPFEPGELLARGRRGDETVCAKVHSWGPAKALRILPEGGSAAVGAVVAIRVLAVDGRGHPVLDWEGAVQFTVHGAAVGRGFRADGRIPLAAGLGRTFVQGLWTPGAAQLEATAEGLAAATHTLTFEQQPPVEPRELS